MDDTEGKRGQLVPLAKRRAAGRARQNADVATVATDASLTRTERAVLFGGFPVDEMTQANALLTAATGLMKLAAQHVARRLSTPSDRTLTAQDRIAMALVPSLAVQLRQNASTRSGTDMMTLGARDPILELLVKVESHPGGSESVGEETTMSSSQDLVRLP